MNKNDTLIEEFLKSYGQDMDVNYVLLAVFKPMLLQREKNFSINVDGGPVFDPELRACVWSFTSFLNHLFEEKEMWEGITSSDAIIKGAQQGVFESLDIIKTLIEGAKEKFRKHHPHHNWETIEGHIEDTWINLADGHYVVEILSNGGLYRENTKMNHQIGPYGYNARIHSIHKRTSLKSIYACAAITDKSENKIYLSIRNAAHEPIATLVCTLDENYDPIDISAFDYGGKLIQPENNLYKYVAEYKEHINFASKQKPAFVQEGYVFSEIKTLENLQNQNSTLYHELCSVGLETMKDLQTPYFTAHYNGQELGLTFVIIPDYDRKDFQNLLFIYGRETNERLGFENPEAAPHVNIIEMFAKSQGAAIPVSQTTDHRHEP